MPTGQLRAIGAHEQHPVQIFDHDDNRPPLAETLKNLDHRLAQLVAVDRDRCRRRCATELGDEMTQRGACASKHEVERLVVELVDEASKQLTKSGEGPDLIAELDTSPDHCPASLLTNQAHELGY